MQCACSNPSPYRLPQFIAFLDRGFKLLFSLKDLGEVVDGESEFVVLRYVSSPQGKASKVEFAKTVLPQGTEGLVIPSTSHWSQYPSHG